MGFTPNRDPNNATPTDVRAAVNVAGSKTGGGTGKPVPGPQGIPGIDGTDGTNGNNGVRGSLWYLGSGAPGAISGELAGDMYFDTASANVYLYSTSWSLQFNLQSALAILAAFGGANQLVQLNGSGQLPALDGSLLTVLPSNVTTQGNTFNGYNQLVQLNSSGQIPNTVDGSLLTNIDNCATSSTMGSTVGACLLYIWGYISTHP